MLQSQEFFQDHADHISANHKIGPDLYRRYNVKRGLRNEDGTGVLVGLTQIGDVHGYILDEGEKTPDEGRLRYRGINVKHLVEGFQSENRFGFEETAYLLLFGKLPTQAQLSAFNEILGELRALPEGLAEDILLRNPSRDIMNKLGRVILSLYSFDEEPDTYTLQSLIRQSMELIARFPALIAYSYQSRNRFFEKQSIYLHDPDPKLSTAENFLRMIRPDASYTRTEAETLDLSLVLHAEHGGGNNSTFTVRVISSAFTDTYAAISAAIGSLKGFRHGGANFKMQGMMTDLEEQVSDWENEDAIKAHLTKLMKGEAYDRAGLIYGMGHAIYTLSDPRAVLLRAKAAELAKEKGGELEKEFALYERVARLAPEVFKEVKKTDKTISPNVDFYSGFVYKMLGVPLELNTPIFAMSRVAGWTAHRIEELAGDSRIIRPAYKSVRPRTDYQSLKDRG